MPAMGAVPKAASVMPLGSGMAWVKTPLLAEADTGEIQPCDR